MATKDIKVGNFYHVLVKVLRIDPTNGEITTETVNEFGTSLNMEPTYFARCEKEAFSPIIPEKGTKNSETAPKYDPCRLFKKGDLVRVVECKGRIKPYLKNVLGKVYTLDASEADNQIVYIKADDIDLIDVCHLELVSPVEELEPYFFGESENSYDVFRRTGNGNQLRSSFWWKHNPTPEMLEMTKKEAKAAAEAECARLNAEYRKEQI